MLCEHLIKTNVLHICIGDQQPSKSLWWPRPVNAMRRIANQCQWSLEPRGFSLAGNHSKQRLQEEKQHRVVVVDDDIIKKNWIFASLHVSISVGI